MKALGDAISETLLTGDARRKVMRTRALVREWRGGKLAFAFPGAMPEQPAWPDTLQLLPPSQMPKRGKAGSDRTRIALWHSLAHIEFVAIDLALDMAGRFGSEMGPDFVSDFLAVAADEAMHFALIERKLATLGSRYTMLPAHSGLWDAAHETRRDVAARLAIVPMVLEARGLDVTPATRERIERQGDSHGAKILSRILDDEIRHVAVGTRHFVALANRKGENPQKYWKNLVEKHFRGTLKPPFNGSARQAAGLSLSFYG